MAGLRGPNAVDGVILGGVAYDPKVVTIWEGFRSWFASQGLAFDYVLYSNYERQVEDLMAGHLDMAWNSPLAWVRARRLGPVEAIAMRDSDCDLTSVVVVRTDSGIRSVDDLAGKRVGVGAVDSPQATLIPLWHLASRGVQATQAGSGAPAVEVVHHNIGMGMHGDHIGGERDAAQALMRGEVDAACMIDGNHLAFSADGTLAAGATRVIAQTPAYDHCNMTVREMTPELAQFRDLLLSMSYSDPDVRPLLDLEGLKEWRDGRTSGYGPLDAAVTEQRFYGADGSVTAVGYRP
ncbi:MAG: phosphate/phosphite/phosphonate ABC transporter substrate-binding protein [Acidimicrobiales bacterium]